ncbi:MAG: phage/plasmid primase, P4 family [Candidatus Paceibacteria bacterium]
MKTTNNLDAALYYCALGWAIIPTNKHKTPLLKSWKEFQKRKPAEREIRTWWAKWPDANPAVITGEMSGLVVLDIDIKHNRSSKEFNIPITVCSKTGSGGEHIFFKHPKQHIKSTNGHLFGNGVDIKADGGLIVLPPGENTNGSYEWLVSPDDAEIAVVPDWLMQATEKQSSSKKKLWQEGLGGVSEGSRNETAASMAGVILSNTKSELQETLGWNQFILWNKTNTPPLDEIELRSVWDSIVALQHGTNLTIQKSLLKEDEYKQLIASSNKPADIAYATAQYLSEKYSIKTPDSKDRKIYAHRDGYYQESENFLRSEIQKILSKKLNRSLRSEILEHIRDLTIVDEKKLKVSVNLINLRNGIYHIKETRLLPHSPEYFFTWQLPVDYHPDASCPTTLKALSDILNKDDIYLLQEWLGYCLYRDYALKKALILVGEQNTGKTTVLKLSESLFGNDNISGVSLEYLTSNRFATANLRDKFINIYDDLSYKDVNDNGIFKMVTGNGTITGEVKFGNQFQFQNHAKLTFSCNKIPNPKDQNDEAYFNRWLVIEFNRQIEKPDPNLFTKISTNEEISGLLNFALVGLHRVLKKGRFSYKKTEDEIKEQMQKSGSPVAQFAYDCLMEHANGTITKDDMIVYFREYAKQHDLPAMNKDKLGKRLPKYAPYIDGGREGSRNLQVSVWQNVKIKDGAFPELDLDDY